MINMEEPKGTFPKQEKNKKAISIGKAGGGGGIGVGIIFFGGVVVSATAAFLIRRRRLQKSTSNNKNSNHDHRSTPSSDSEIPYKFLEDTNKNQDKGLQSVPPDSSPYTDSDQNLSNGTAKIGVHESDTTKISDQTFFLDQKYEVKANKGKGDPVSNDDEIMHSISPKGLVSPIQFDASVVEKEESPLPLGENQALFQPENVADHLSREEIGMIQEDDSIDTALVDLGKEEENQQTIENLEGEEVKTNCSPDEDLRELNCQEAAESTTEDQRTITILQSSEEQETPFHCDQESDSTGNLSLSKYERIENEESSLVFENVQELEKDKAFEVADAEQDEDGTMTQMSEVHGSVSAEDFGASNRTEELGPSHDDQGKGNTPIVMFAEEENKCDNTDVSLRIETNEGTTGNETLEATDVDEQKGTVALMSEGGQNKRLVGLLVTETVEVEMQEEAEDRDSEFVLVEEEKGVQHDEEIIGEESQATRERAQFPDDIASGSYKQKLQKEPESSLNGDQEDNSVPDDSSSENCGATVPNMSLTEDTVPAQLKPGIGTDSGFAEVQLTAETTEAGKENIASEPAIEDSVAQSENLPVPLVEEQQHLNGHNGKQLEEVEDTFKVNYAENVTGIEEHNLMRPEEDSLNDDDGGDDVDEAYIPEKVEESSEGTGDSSVGSNSEPIWPAESLEEVSTELKELKINEQKEEKQMEENQTVKTQEPMHFKSIDSESIIANSIQKGNDHQGNSKVSFFRRFMMELAEKTHQPTYSRKLRILMPTLLVVSWSLCFWNFGQPFLKISLIVILIKILYKIQGF
ncbi:hypothetical protein ACH5RR_019998 [Cinchona calisaya]|uniref:Uncharacterized protein n=1 Tax=Cinchona calisaya TaxID=153742 RepID=A0ABD2ZD55_9GENT